MDLFDIRQVFKELAESSYDAKLELTLSDKESGVKITSTINKDNLRDANDVSNFVALAMNEASNACAKSKFKNMKSFKADVKIDVDLELAGQKGAARKVLEKLKEEGAKAAYMSLLLTTSFDSLEDFKFVEPGSDPYCITRQVGTIDGIKIFFYGDLACNDTTVFYE